MRRYCALILGIAVASAGIAAEDGKRKRKNKKQTVQVSAAEVAAFVPRLKPVGNAAPVIPNRQLRIKTDEVKKVAGTLDKIILTKLKENDQAYNPECDDATFVRRIYLNVVGRIPTVAETRTFLNDSAPDKRAKLIDELLISDGYRSHIFNWLGDMLRYRSGHKRFNFALYERWLKDQIAINRPWDEMVGEMVTAEGSLASNGASGYLLRDAGMPLDGLANTVSLFLGANVACAQCHDHPLADWTQREFYELTAFFGATDVSSRDPRKVGNAVKTDGLTKQDVMQTVAQNMARVKTLPKQDLTFPDDYAYDDVKPGSSVNPMIVHWNDALDYDPKFSTKNSKALRGHFADWMTNKENPRFAVAIANRLWGRAFGIAAQEPIDDLDDLSLSENPKLLKMLGHLVVLTQFDLREVQRVIYNTRAFQAKANVMPPDGDRDDYLFPGPVLRRMTAEQAWDSTQVMADGHKVDSIRVDNSHFVTRFAYDFDATPLPMVRKTAFAMKEAGYLITKRTSEEKKRDRAAGVNVGNSALRASEMAQPQRDDHFLRMFGQSTREVADDGSLEGNVPQSLALMNGDIQEVLTDRKSNFMKTFGKLKKDKAIEYLYLQFYSRPPTAKETAIIRESMRDDTTMPELVWVLFNSPEFLFIK